MTRQNVTDGPREVMTKKCPTCGGDGIVVSEHTAAVDIERRLRSLVTPGSRDKAFKVEVTAKVAWLVAGPGGSRLRELEETTKRRFFLVGVEGEHLDHLRVLDQGTVEKVAPKLPVEIGQEIEVKLGEVGLHDPHAGVGKVGDVDIVVGDAAKLVGKKVTATVTAVTEGLAWAELRRAGRGRRRAAHRRGRGREADARQAGLRPQERRARGSRRRGRGSTSRPDEEPEADERARARTRSPPSRARTPLPPCAKKRTRRGSRGGKNRKKKPAVAAAGGATAASLPPRPKRSRSGAGAGAGAGARGRAEPEPASEPAAGAGRAGDPPARPQPRRRGRATATAAAPVKKKTRRGSRGGKNRRKKPAGAARRDRRARRRAGHGGRRARARACPQPDAEEARPSANGDEDWGYTPMSEWGLDE